MTLSVDGMFRISRKANVACYEAVYTKANEQFAMRQLTMANRR